MDSGLVLRTPRNDERKCSRDAICVRVFQFFLAPQTEGAGHGGCTLHPRSRAPYAQAKKSAHEHTGQRRQSDIPCAMVLRLTSCSPRWGGLVVTVIPEKRQLLENLTPASRRQDHTTWPYAPAFSSGAKKHLTPKRPSQSRPYV